jgi:hypothetical protein
MKQLRDEGGTEWTVYQVNRHVRPTGRRLADILPAAYADGWLVFQSVLEKRRLAPFPSNWEELPDATLRSFLAAATPTRPSGAVDSTYVEGAFLDEERSSSKEP